MKKTAHPRAPASEARGLRTVGNSGRCDCSQPVRCVLRLELPPVQGTFLDGQGRLWTVLGRDQFADPITGRINYTRVLLRRFGKVNGKPEPVYLPIRCGSPEPFENRYEQGRQGRPPRSVRLPFEPATPVNR